MSILRNGNAACLCHLFSPMSHVELRKRACPMSLHFQPPCHVSQSPMLHVEFKEWQCPPFDFRGPELFSPELTCKKVMKHGGT